MTTPSESKRIPTWIMLYGAFLALFGASLGVLCYVDLGKFIAGYVPSGPAYEKAAMLLASRNLGMAATMATALVSRNARWLQLAFIMRAFTESQDVVIDLLRTPPLAVVPAVVLALELLAVRSLSRVRHQSMGDANDERRLEGRSS